MMPSKGKNKGNSGELRIAKFLTELFGEKFIRVPNSGAMVGGANAHRKLLMDSVQISYFKSDIIPPGSMKKLVVESKFYAQFQFHLLTTNKPIPQLDKWIKQTLDTVDPGDLWFLVVRINHKGSFAVFDQEHLANFQVGNHARYFSYVWCDFESLFENNRDKIRELCSTPA
jgi:hypothetical protein